MMQGFEWSVQAREETFVCYADRSFRRSVPADDGKHWVRLDKRIPQLGAWGIENIWVPPG